MADIIDSAVLEDALARAEALSLRFLERADKTRPVPFTFTPCPIASGDFETMKASAILLGQLTQAIAHQSKLIQEVHAPLASGDPFFAELLYAHEQLHRHEGGLLRVPLLLQRSDFMIDAQLGPRLVECNSIAAGMAPFGEQVGILHRQLEQHSPSEYAQLRSTAHGKPIANPATQHMAQAIKSAAATIAGELDDDGPLQFLIVVQENEDNVFDQALLEKSLRDTGVKTYRRTFRELHQQLSTGPNQSLLLQDCGNIHVVYLRAGYQFHDYVARDLDTKRCCDALRETRTFIERHRVALNATVAQQLATSKRMQLHLAQDKGELLAQLGFNAAQRTALAEVFAPMKQVDASTSQWLQREGRLAKWVLKNQGEGGGHCLFNSAILKGLEQLGPDDYGAWTLMHRLRPKGRDKPTLVVRGKNVRSVTGLVSEIGIFTAHLCNQTLPTADEPAGYVGYLVRSKPPHVTEGGVHSGYGALDSLYTQT